MVKVANNGQDVVATDFWSTPHAESGLLYFTPNAGAIRLLVPPSKANEVLEAARSAELVIFSRGPWTGAGGGRDSIEILFEDGSDTPFVVHIDARQAERLWPRSEDGREVPCSLWIQGPDGPEDVEKALELPARVRHVPEIPYLQPWGQ